MEQNIPDSKNNQLDSITDNNRLNVEPEKIKSAKAWFRERIKSIKWSDVGAMNDELREWCICYNEDGGEAFFESELDEIWEGVRTEEMIRRKKSGQWFIDEEERYDIIYPYSWSEIEQLEFPEQPWRIRNLLPLQGFVILAGVSGDGKSFVSMEMANALTMPRPFLNEASFDVVGTNVLYVDAEMSKSELQRRGKQLGFSGDREHQIYFVSRDALNLKGDDDYNPDLEKITSIIEKHDIGVVFMDTLRAVAGGLEENKAEEVRRFFNQFKPLKDAGVCVVFLDHLRKEYGPKRGAPQKDNLLASQDKTASVEVLLMLQRKGGEPIISMHQRKNRLGQEIASFDIRMYDTDMNDANNKIILEYAGAHEEVESTIERAKAVALEALQDADMTRQELLKYLSDHADIGKRTAHVALKSLHEGKLVGVEKVGKQHKYSTKTGDVGDDDNEIPLL